MGSYSLITFDHYFQRLIGLIGKRSINPLHVFHFVPCNSVHTFGMMVPLTIIFLDRQMHVLHVIAELMPCRVAWHRHASSVLEMRAGTIASIEQASALVDALFFQCKG